MISNTSLYFCRNYTEIENYDEAINDQTQIWDCHHRKEIEDNKTSEQLIKEGLYYNRPPEELIFLTHLEHTRLHGQNIKDEHRKKLSEAHKGQVTWNKGKTLSEEHKRKLSESHSGSNCYIFGKHLSEETKRKMSESRKKYYQKIRG